jgi:hypothetical protein
MRSLRSGDRRPYPADQSLAEERWLIKSSSPLLDGLWTFALEPVTGVFQNKRVAMGAAEDVDLASLASSSDHSPPSPRFSNDASPLPSPRSSLSRLSFSYNDILVPLTVSAEDPRSDARLEKLKSVTFWSGLSLVVGLQIGSGIFSSPALVNGDAGSVGMALIVWIIAGCLAWTGACMSLYLNLFYHSHICSFLCRIGCRNPLEWRCICLYTSYLWSLTRISILLGFDCRFETGGCRYHFNHICEILQSHFLSISQTERYNSNMGR